MKFAFAAALIAVANAAEWGQSYGGQSYGGYGYSQPQYKSETKYVPQVRVTPGYSSKNASQVAKKKMVNHAGSNFDAYGRDQDLSIDESYGSTQAKSYRAESYDEWDNQDRDKYGASSKGASASDGKWDKYAKGGQNSAYQGQKGHYANSHAGGRGYGEDDENNASVAYGAQKGGYDNDEWAKQAAGSDYDSRYGKSYDAVDAKSYDNTRYARDVRADDDQWAEDYDRYGKKDVGAYGAAASTWNTKGDAASEDGKSAYWGKQASDWDAWGRDQDYKEKISYDQTRAKAYSAESYDEWDNRDDDTYGAQAWGKDRDVYGASSYGKADSMKEYDQYGGYGSGAAAQGSSYGGSKTVKTAAPSKGHGWGSKGQGYGAKTVSYGGSQSASSGQGAYAKGGSIWEGASRAGAAAVGGYDNDEWAKQAHGSDYDSRYGKSYDRVSARSYENEMYARDLQVDDDMWAEDYDRYDDKDAMGYGSAASKEQKLGYYGKGKGSSGWGGYYGKGKGSS